MTKFVSGTLRAAGAAVSRRAGEIRAQAPGARMVGEFAVRSGVREMARRLSGRDNKPGGPSA